MIAIARLIATTEPAAPLSALEAAGQRLDDARIRFDALGSFPCSEAVFGRAEAAFLDALAAYKAELTRVTGCDADRIARRLG